MSGILPPDDAVRRRPKRRRRLPADASHPSAVRRRRRRLRRRRREAGRRCNAARRRRRHLQRPPQRHGLLDLSGRAAEQVVHRQLLPHVLLRLPAGVVAREGRLPAVQAAVQQHHPQRAVARGLRPALRGGGGGGGGGGGRRDRRQVQVRVTNP